MKLTDIYPDITIEDFNFELSRADVVIDGDNYRLARIYRQADGKFPEFSYNVVYPRIKNTHTVNIDDIIFVPDEFVNNPVKWSIKVDVKDVIRDNVFKRGYFYYIYRNNKMFMGYFESKNTAETVLRMIKRHPFDFDFINWDMMINRYPVKFMGIPGRIEKYISCSYNLACTLVISDKVSINDLMLLEDKVNMITETSDPNMDKLFKSIVFDIDCSDLFNKRKIELSLLNPYILLDEGD